MRPRVAANRKTGSSGEISDAEVFRSEPLGLKVNGLWSSCHPLVPPTAGFDHVPKSSPSLCANAEQVEAANQIAANMTQIITGAQQ